MQNYPAKLSLDWKFKLNQNIEIQEQFSELLHFDTVNKFQKSHLERLFNTQVL